MMNPPRVDCHAHVWDRSCAFVADARYHPDYEATIETYLRVLDAHGVESAILVQPSFLGTDNRYLLDCLRAHPDRLRGVSVLSGAESDAELDDQRAAGVIGTRFNLVGRDPALMNAGETQTLLNVLAMKNWQAQVQVDGEHLKGVLAALAPHDMTIVVDHFGRPDAEASEGVSALLELEGSNAFLKFSAPYRQRCTDLRRHARMLARCFGADRCLWGSDWPWTQFEDALTYREAIAFLEDLIEADDVQTIRSSRFGF